MSEFLFNKLAGLRPATLLKKTLTQGLFCKFFEVFKNTLFVNNLRATAVKLVIHTSPAGIYFFKVSNGNTSVVSIVDFQHVNTSWEYIIFMITQFKSNCLSNFVYYF